MTPGFQAHLRLSANGMVHAAMAAAVLGAVVAVATVGRNGSDDATRSALVTSAGGSNMDSGQALLPDTEAYAAYGPTQHRGTAQAPSADALSDLEALALYARPAIGSRLLSDQEAYSLFGLESPVWRGASGSPISDQAAWTLFGPLTQ